MSAITISIPGRPVPWARAARGKGHSYTPARQKAQMHAIAWAAKAEMRGAPPMTGILAVDALFQYELPRGWPAAQRAAALLGEYAPIGKPDLDNLLKLPLDALSGVVFDDDARIVTARLLKRYGAQALTVISVHQVGREQVRAA